MSLAGWIVRVMFVLVMFIVSVEMLVFQVLMCVFVMVRLGDVQPDADCH
jgi:hypothetical protein